MRQSCAMGIPLGKTVEVKASGGSAKHPAENPSLSAKHIKPHDRGAFCFPRNLQVCLQRQRGNKKQRTRSGLAGWGLPTPKNGPLSYLVIPGSNLR
jgi:hypothetical protein